VTADYVRDLEDYWLWLDRLIGSSSGWLDAAVLVVQPIEPYEAASSDEWLGLIVPHQSLSFADGSRLWFDLVIDVDLISVKYSFHYQDVEGRLIWRKCNHEGHERAGREHIHRHPNDPDRVDPYKLVALAEVIQEVWDYLENGTRPSNG
jgi:hypothetical protein